MITAAYCVQLCGAGRIEKDRAMMITLLLCSFVVGGRGWSGSVSLNVARGIDFARKCNHYSISTTTLFFTSPTVDLSSSSISSSTSTSADKSIDTSSTSDASVANMRLSEIKSELQKRNIDYSDCFDKESVISRLVDARQKQNNGKNDDDISVSNSNSNSSSIDDKNKNEEGKEEKECDADFNRCKVVKELKSKTVRELREELGRRRIPRTGLFEKQDIISALVEAREKASVYCATGLLTPGEVSDLNSFRVRKEIDFSGTLLLLDIYATWCGPCKMLSPILEEIASDERENLRIIKMDSDKNSEFASELKVGGLPTLVLFQNGNEINRLEGAPPTKDSLQEWIDSNR